MATMPSRLPTFRRAFESIIGQVDRFYLFLDGHKSVPDFARRDNVFIMHSAREGRLGASGKFLGLTHEKSRCVYLTVDDDILYPPDYVETLTAALARFKGGVVVGIHGAFFIEPYLSFVEDQDVCNYNMGLDHHIQVDYVGCGTAAFVSSALPINPRNWPEWDMDDLMCAISAEQRGVPRVAIPRPPHFLKALASNQDDSLWRKSTRDDSRQTKWLRRLVEMEMRSPMGLPPRRSNAMSNRMMMAAEQEEAEALAAEQASLAVSAHLPGQAPTAPRHPAPPASHSP